MQSTGKIDSRPHKSGYMHITVVWTETFPIKRGWLSIPPRDEHVWPRHRLIGQGSLNLLICHAVQGVSVDRSGEA
jgi:hypothetical protein